MHYHPRYCRTLVGALALGLAVPSFSLPADAATQRTTRTKAKTSTTVTTVTAVARASTSTAATTAAPPVRPTGPIKMLVTYRETVNDNTFNVLAAVQARVAVLNAGGGINGRRIEIITCNTRFELSGSQECARRAVAEKVALFFHAAGGTVAAPAGSPIPFANDSSVIMPILSQAGIAWVGPFIAPGGEDATNPVAFPIGSLPAAVAGVAIALVKQGCSRIAFAGAQLGGRESFRRGLASVGRESVFETVFPRADPASLIPALVARNVDCLFAGSTESEMRTLITALDRSGSRIRLAWVDGVISERGMTLLGPSIDGSIVSSMGRSSLDPSDPIVKQYRNELDAFNRGVSYDQFGYQAWAATDLAIKAMAGISGEVNADSTLAALRRLKTNSPVFGPLDFTRDLADPLYRRMFTTNVAAYKIVNGRYALDSEFDLRSLFDKKPA
jgi:ABC-type branched-subunit amino acid transport system substrate-binding protein